MSSEIDKILNDEKKLMPYKVGALMYCPGNHETVAEGIIEERFGNNYSLALCLEDSISDKAIEKAEDTLVSTIEELRRAKEEKEFYMPDLFVRVREPEQICEIVNKVGKNMNLLDGFVFPKLSNHNAKMYIEQIINASDVSGKRLYMMPTLESADLISLRTRYDSLYNIKDELDGAKEYVLNIRVGGNDFCKGFGIRRHFDETIYDIRPVANILCDIVTCFSMDYVVSGPVWEYFGSSRGEWKRGLERELRLDRINGFIGKTVIHPNQIEVVNDSLKVDEDDLNDALSIIKLTDNESVFVEKSVSGVRMNEYKTHAVWAEKIIRLAKIYGVNEKWSRREEKIIPL